MRKRILWFMAGVAMACSGGEDDFVSSESGREMPLLKPEIEAMDGVLPASLAAGDLFGIYVACGDAGSEPVLQASGNYRDNAPVVYNEGSLSWDEEIYFPLNGGDMAVYAYAPYIEAVENSLEVPFAVEVDQYPEGAYEASDFLFASARGQEAGTETVTLQFHHILSKLQVRLIKGEDFEGELPDDAEVYIHHTVPSATIDLSVGIATKYAYGSEQTIRARSLGGHKYAAIIVPQRLPGRRPLLEVVMKGVSYLVESSFAFDPVMRICIPPLSSLLTKYCQPSTF